MLVCYTVLACDSVWDLPCTIMGSPLGGYQGEIGNWFNL